jgi:hypothetical protein|uniref:Uncharacterized protein n=1 Tax=viral metagenome TaxID=1070528 RepID=A0A6C0IIM0_9ZZZZ
MNNQYKFIEWQNLYIESRKYGPIKIKTGITYFMNDGLIPFLKNYGYIFELNNMMVGNILSTTMYRLLYNKLYTFPTRENVYFNDEHFQHFEQVISDDEWSNLYKFWNSILDNLLDEIKYIEIKCICWMYIDMIKSNTVIQYLESYEDSDIEQDKKNNIDPYLLEQKNNYTVNPKFIYDK